MEDIVDGAIDVDEVRYVILEKGKTRAADVRDVADRSGQQVVHADHLVTSGQEVVTEMRPDESRPSRNQDPHK